MARIARVVVPRFPHHVTQRGNRRQPVFFSDDDYLAYIKLLSETRENAGVEVWAYCLMPNHVHLIVTPNDTDGLRRFLGEAHRHYTRRVNFREGWRGHLWQERFHSFVMDEPHLLAAARYVELNPVRAHLCDNAEEWPWSSARAHLRGEDDGLVSVGPMLELVNRWHDYLTGQDDARTQNKLRLHSRTGRPLGSEAFMEHMEKQSGRQLRIQKPGRKPRS